MMVVITIKIVQVKTELKSANGDDFLCCKFGLDKRVIIFSFRYTADNFVVA